MTFARLTPTRAAIQFLVEAWSGEQISQPLAITPLSELPPRDTYVPEAGCRHAKPRGMPDPDQGIVRLNEGADEATGGSYNRGHRQLEERFRDLQKQC